MKRERLGLCAAFLMSGCTHSSVVLLQDEGGGHGEITIQQARGTGPETVMNEANVRATLGGSQPSLRPVGAKGLGPSELALLAGLPPPPKSFTLYFIEGTTTMTPESISLLDEVRAEVTKRPGAELQVTGHTDTVGSEADNDVLSRKRADEVLNLLAGMGFQRDRMIAVGRGERELKVPTGDNVSSPRNRRVELIVR